MQQPPIKLSVITVVYNGEASIRRTLESVLHQNVPPTEYIIVDGASKDNTLSICREYEEAFRAQGVKYCIYSEPDHGIYDAMNKGIRLATGDYVAMLNSDDWYETDALQIVYDAYVQQPFDFAYGSIIYTGKKGKILVKKSKLDIVVSSRNWNHPSSVVRRDLYLRHPFDLSLKTYADFSWFLSMRRNPAVRITIFPADRPLTNFTAGGASINASFHSMLTRAKEKYAAYRRNGYSRWYLFEAYGWEFVKFIFARIFAG